MRALALLGVAAAALAVAVPATSKGELPAAWIHTRSVDLELALGSYCFADSDVNPTWLRGQCREAAPPQTRTDLPTAFARCGEVAGLYFPDARKLSSVTLQLSAKTYRLRPHNRVTGEGDWATASWRVRGRNGLLSLSVIGPQGQLAYHAHLRIWHKGCRLR